MSFIVDFLGDMVVSSRRGKKYEERY